MYMPLYNKKNLKIYVGQTKDLEERITLHSSKVFKDSYTVGFDGKWELIYTEKVSSKQDALKREKQLKSHRGRDFIKQNIPR